MARGGKIGLVRKVSVDPVYGSKIIAKFINKLMVDGKKSVATSILYGSFDDCFDFMLETWMLNKEEGEEKPSDQRLVIWFVEYIINKVVLMVELKSKRVGGANYRIPSPISPYRALSKALSSIVRSARARTEKSMRECLSAEFRDILKGVGETLKRKELMKKDIDANKAFAHYAMR